MVVSTVDATAVGGRVGTCFCSGSVGGVVGIDCHTQRDGGGCGEEAPPPAFTRESSVGGEGAWQEREKERLDGVFRLSAGVSILSLVGKRT